VEKLLGKKDRVILRRGHINKKGNNTHSGEKKEDRYTNAQYITMTGFGRYPLDQLDNKDIDNTLSAFGKIVVPTDDVYGGNITSQKKRK